MHSRRSIADFLKLLAVHGLVGFKFVKFALCFQFFFLLLDFVFSQDRSDVRKLLVAMLKQIIQVFRRILFDFFQAMPNFIASILLGFELCIGIRVHELSYLY